MIPLDQIEGLVGELKALDGFAKGRSSGK
jgi:hypothetical protein